MKEETTILRGILRPMRASVRMAGLLRWDSSAKADALSDVDLFVLMRGGRPSDYFRVCSTLCRGISESLPNHFIFASFRQQVLLSALSQRPRATPLHFLQYLGVRHLVIREVNTLPRFLPQSLRPLAGRKQPILKEIQEAYSDRASLLHPSLTRFFYYFDILNETLAFFGNRNGVLPEAVILNEAMHKLKFTARCLALEIVSPNLAPESNRFKTFDEVDALLRSLGYRQLITLREEVGKCLAGKSCPPRERVAHLLELAYSVFDMIETITEPVKEVG